MKIAIVGAGHVGGTLARRWSQLGHDVVLGQRDPSTEKARTQAASLGVAATTSEAAVQSAQMVLLATPGDAAIAAARACGPLGDRILVDATNPLKPQLDGLDHPGGLSGAQQIAQALPGARIVKAFNTVGFGIMAQPIRDSRKSVLFISGDDAEANQRVSALAADTGFEPVYLGDLSASRMQEEHALLWIHMAIKAGYGQDFIFSLCRGPA
ncbi:NAD(P)-binding domain-containing protein [uncultured Paludibaculum sp.]|uniref:NADPH-dependent F420 reductase n=1 Tax=uncultured Paludibaculum sp. TaxID=1765020 RepID=UPI002AAAF915|nr:NAD(P)-binding domain-containing protein [uncultured Paludibaculum sp.]